MSENEGGGKGEELGCQASYEAGINWLLFLFKLDILFHSAHETLHLWEMTLTTKLDQLVGKEEEYLAMNFLQNVPEVCLF